MTAEGLSPNNQVVSKEISERKKNIIIFASLGAAAIATVLTYPNGPIDALGDYPTKVTQSQAEEENRIEFGDYYKQLSVSDRFILQYITPDYNEVSPANDGNGLLGFIGKINSASGIVYGQSCLSASAFDITPSYTRDGTVNSSSALTYNEESSIVRIIPSSNKNAQLVFSVDASSGELFPKPTTKDTLDAYDCNTTEAIAIRNY